MGINIKINAPLAQLNRVSLYEREGRRFKSYKAHQDNLIKPFLVNRIQSSGTKTMELSKRCLWHDLLERMRLLSQCSRKRPHLRGSVLFLIVSELLTGVLRKKMRAECLPTRVKKAIFKGLQFSWLEPSAHILQYHIYFYEYKYYWNNY